MSGRGDRAGPIAATKVLPVLLVAVLVGAWGCEDLEQKAQDILKDDVHYWLVLTAIGLLLYRVSGLVSSLKSLWRFRLIPILFAGGMAWFAFSWRSDGGTEWHELLVGLGIWGGAAIVGRILHASGSAGGERAAEEHVDARETEAEDPEEAYADPEPEYEEPTEVDVADEASPPGDEAWEADPAPEAEEDPIADTAPAPLSVDSDEVLRERLAARCAKPPQINLPPGWKGSKEPWGDSDDALALLMTPRQTKHARELLRRLCKADRSAFDPLVLAAFDLTRPPEDRKKSYDYLTKLNSLDEGTSEYFSIMCLGTYASRNYETLWSYYSSIGESEVASNFGHWLAMMSTLCASDLLFQTIFRPAGSEMATMFANSAIVGVAQLLMRQHVRAFGTFAEGRERAEQFPGKFAKAFGTRLSRKQRTQLAAMLGTYCRIGQGLTLYDVGLAGSARAVIAQVAEEGNLAEDMQERVDGFLRWNEHLSD